MNTADIVMIVFILLMLVIGFSKGFVKMAIGLLTGIAAFIASAFLARPIANALREFAIFDGAKSAIQKFFTDKSDAATKTIAQTVNDIVMPDFMKQSLLKDFPNPSQTLKAGADTLADKVFFLMLMCIAFVLLLIVIRIVFFIIEKSMESAFKKIKILDATNRILGAAFSLLQSALVIYIVLAIIALLASRIPSIVSVISDSSIVSKLYFNNVLLQLLA
jgi:uncharacterized membrane protein required for colicin V production